MDLAGLSFAVLAGFALTSLLIELTPGPNMAYLAVIAATEGRKPGYAVVAGVALGLGVVGLLAALGLAAVIAASPPLYQALRWAGVVYLLWLAFDTWRDAGAVEAGPRGQRMGLYFRRGLVTNLLNPKAAVFYVAILPGFVDPAQPLMPQTLVLSAVFVVVATSIHAGIVTLAGTARRLLDDPQREMVVRRGFAVALALIALWFAWKTRG